MNELKQCVIIRKAEPLQSGHGDTQRGSVGAREKGGWSKVGQVVDG